MNDHIGWTQKLFFQGGLCNSEHEAERQRMRMTCVHILCTHTQTISLLQPSMSLLPLSGPKICMSVRLYFEVKPVRSVICCGLFTFLLACLPYPFPHSVRLGWGSFIWPAWAMVQYSALWFILIKWPQPETGERSSEYGQALSATANLSLLTLAFPLLMLKWGSMRQEKTTDA